MYKRQALSEASVNILIYSLSITVSYNSAKVLQGVSYMMYSSYYALNTISDIKPGSIVTGISLSDNTINFIGNNIVITPKEDFTITVLSR